jgi:lysophospholipase L1-like esterase
MKRLVVFSLYLVAIAALSFVAIEIALRLYVHAPVFAVHDWRGINATALDSGGIYDPNLGWVQPANFAGGGFNTIAYGIRKNSSREETISPGAILAVGDSYTVGSQVTDDESWPAQLERQARVRVFNAGVGGYGLDQIVLNAERLLPVLRPRLVLVGIYQETIVRANYSSYGVPKPYFIVDGGEWHLKNHPVPQRASVEKEPLYRTVLAHFLSFHLVFQRFFFDWWYSHGVVHFEQASNAPGETSCYLLARLQRQLAAVDAAGVVVIQYPGYTYVRAHPRPAYVLRALQCARELGYEIVDEFDHITAIASQSINKLQEQYVMSPEGGYGHMSARGNALIASLVAERLQPLQAKLSLPAP